VQFGWKRLLDNFSELNLRYFHIQENQHEDLPVYLNGIYFPGPVVQRLDVSRDELDVQHIKQLYESNRLVYGANYQRNQVNGQSIMPPISLSLSSAQVIENFQVFANDEWRLNKRMLLNVGAMLERDNNGYQNTSPRASLNFHLTPEHTLRTSISVAYRNPAITETNKPAIQPGVLFIPSAEATSPDLVPEKMISREIGYLGNFRDEMAMLDIRLFSDSLSNGIVPSSGVLVNGLSADYQGFEGTLKKKWADTSDLTVNFSHIFATSNTMALAAAGNTYFDSSYDMLSASIPKNSASLLYSLRLASNYSFSASYYYQDSSQPFDRGPIDFQPVQHRTDIRIARNFHVDNKMNGNVALVIQNLFNTDYTEYISSNEFHRCGYITLTIDF
jgi:iron complex outermembrane receptor protein